MGGGSQERYVLYKLAVPLESPDLSQERSDVGGDGQSVLLCCVPFRADSELLAGKGASSYFLAHILGFSEWQEGVWGHLAFYRSHESCLYQHRSRLWGMQT